MKRCWRRHGEFATRGVSVKSPCTISHHFASGSGDPGVAGLVLCCVQIADEYEAVEGSFQGMCQESVERVAQGADCACRFQRSEQAPHGCPQDCPGLPRMAY